MAIDKDIIKLLKAEGFKTNEAIVDALTEFIEVVQDENADMEEGIEENDKEQTDDSDDDPRGER